MKGFGAVIKLFGLFLQLFLWQYLEMRWLFPVDHIRYSDFSRVWTSSLNIFRPILYIYELESIYDGESAKSNGKEYIDRGMISLFLLHQIVT